MGRLFNPSLLVTLPPAVIVRTSDQGFKRSSQTISTPAIMQSSTRPSISLIPLVHDNNDPALRSSRKHYQVPRTGIPFCSHGAIPIARCLSQLSSSRSCSSSHYYSWPCSLRSLRPSCKLKSLLLPLLPPSHLPSVSLASMDYSCVFIRSWSHTCSPSISIFIATISDIIMYYYCYTQHPITITGACQCLD
jgi:hypothetical protein